MELEVWLERLSAADPGEQQSERAPGRLKASIYSAVVNQLSEAGTLRPLEATKTSGYGLCVFEEVVRLLPGGEQLGSMNLCRACHARLLAERMNNAPIFWSHCPYAEFHREGK